MCWIVESTEQLDHNDQSVWPISYQLLYTFDLPQPTYHPLQSPIESTCRRCGVREKKLYYIINHQYSAIIE